MAGLHAIIYVMGEGEVGRQAQGALANVNLHSIARCSTSDCVDCHKLQLLQRTS